MATKTVEPQSQSEDEESQETDDSESSESFEEEEVEPRLKYERIGNDVNDIFCKDAASCMAVHTKFVALGTHWGTIHILDQMGNNIKELSPHVTTINQISIDDNGDYMASCSDDGKVVVHGLYSNDNNQTLSLDRPVKAVAIDPNFFKHNKGKQFVTGEDSKLVLNEKGFLSRYKQTVLYQGEGPIRNIQWKSHFVAWANDMGVKVYDTSLKQKITYIVRDNPQIRPDLYRCNLCWKDERTLLIGWAEHVKVCVVKDRRDQDGRDLPSRYVEIVAMFRTDWFICGIAPHGPDHVALLSYEESEVQYKNGKLYAPRPHLRIVHPRIDFFDEISNEALSIRGFTECRCNDYHLECLKDENQFYIVSPKDIVVARLRDTDDHIQWLVEHDRFPEAMATAQEYSKVLKRYSYQSIGRQYMEYLLKTEQFDEAGRICVKVLGKNKELWEQEVYKFAHIHQLKAITPYLPRGEPKLSPAIYEMVLNDFLQTDQQGFQSLIKDWPSDLYSIQAIVNAVLDILDRKRDNHLLLQCLGDLYTHDKRYDKALGIYMRLKHQAIFETIHKHNLFETVSDKIVMLMDVDKERAVKLCLDNIDKIPIEKVVKQLENSHALLHIYLDQLFKRDPHAGQQFHDLQVKLYAEYDRARLLPFLRSSNYYPLQGALQVCQERDYIPEMVFLLGRMGNTKQALNLITTKLEDVDQAIEFCKEHNDRELWEDLIAYSMDKPSFITGLLNNIGTHVDPIILIKQIREGMKIPGLRDSLVKILQDYNLQRALREGCKRILVSDCYNLLDRLVRTQRKGVRVDTNQMCQGCHEPLIASDMRYLSNVIVFYCHHSFHEDCLPAHNPDSCMICSAQQKQRGPGNLTSPRR